MKLIEMKCKNCGSVLNVDENSTEINCEYCHAKYKLDDEVKHVKYDDMEQSGYEFEKGKIRAQEELKQKRIEEENKLRQAQYEEERRKKNLKWWILGWIFLFPVPLTILIWKSQLTTKVKIIITVILWGGICLCGILSPADETDTDNTNNQTEIVQQQEATSTSKIIYIN